jgi:hypothetical protein
MGPKQLTNAAGQQLELQEPEDPDRLREDIRGHIRALELPEDKACLTGTSKAAIRASHALQRADVYRREVALVGKKANSLLSRFAEGYQVDPRGIQPTLVPVVAGSEESDLFRLATLLWSVPVSHGYGRRMRYLVVDRNNDKLMGIFALGDPVFNLRARDSWLGWDVAQRRHRLVDIMDAFIVGAVPPYTSILGGKLVASLIGSAEVAAAFEAKYGTSTGIISKESKHARLSLVTITSALGRSSIYNRLVLRADPDDAKSPVLVRLDRIGKTSGYGHFQLSDELFARLKNVLRQANHPYVGQNRFGQGPNWRMRVIRVGLEQLGLDPDVLRHGIAREVFAMPIAANAREYLRGDELTAAIDRPSAASIAEAARARWVIPRAERNQEYREFAREDLLALLGAAKPDS